jgi:hypothetical protein
MYQCNRMLKYIIINKTEVFKVMKSQIVIVCILMPCCNLLDGYQYFKGTLPPSHSVMMVTQSNSYNFNNITIHYIYFPMVFGWLTLYY